MGHYDNCREGYCGCGQSLDAKGNCLMGTKCSIEIERTLDRKYDKQMIKDLSMLVSRLARRLPKSDKVALTALDYLKRKSLTGNILRNQWDTITTVKNAAMKNVSATKSSKPPKRNR